MATIANGALTPPVPAPEPTTDSSVAKRKRDDSEQQSTETARPETAQTQLDILDVLQRYDTQPSFLEHSITATAADQPAQKKARLSTSANDHSTISSNLRTGAYASLSQLEEDASRVSKELASSLRSAENASGRPSVEDLKRIQRVGALEQLVKEIVDRESRAVENAPQKENGVKIEHDGLANGHVPASTDKLANKAGTVLTLFGNAPTPKQLFSSMQHKSDSKADSGIKVELPVEEMGLPNGLAATKIMPSGTTDAKAGPTFEDAFAPPYSLPQLHPPKARKRSAAKDTTVTWEFKDPVARGSKRGGYTTQSLTTADWLGYGGVDPANTAASTREKRKQRDRALSGSDVVQTAPTKATLEAELEAQEEALFRRAYNSFAPSSDNSKSLVSAETKAMVWFAKLGDRRFHEKFASDPALTDESSLTDMAIDPALLEPATEEEDFGKVVEELDSLPEDSLVDSDRDRSDPEQVLREISELLETLASHQHIRNASLPSTASASRTPISPAPMLTSRIGRPDSPAEDEVNTYIKLRHEIAYLALKLPPYAVAKLDGDQLAELGVSKLLPFETRDYKGSMEEDQVSRLSKYTAAATAAGLASLTRQTSSTSGQHYSNASGRTPAIGAAANTRYGSSNGLPTKTPATAPAYARSTSNQSYGTPSAAPRQTYAPQPHQYSSRPGAPTQNGYGQSAAQQQQQYYSQARPQQTPGGYNNYGQTYGQATPQTQQRPNYASSQSLQQFQQRSQAAAQNAATYQPNTGSQPPVQSPYKRTASPALQPMQAATAQQGYQRSAYANPGGQQASQYGQQPGSGRGTPTYSQPQTPVNGMPRAPPPLMARAASGTPQPQNIAPHPPQNQGMTNGHADEAYLRSLPDLSQMFAGQPSMAPPHHYYSNGYTAPPPGYNQPPSAPSVCDRPSTLASRLLPLPSYNTSDYPNYTPAPPMPVGTHAGYAAPTALTSAHGGYQGEPRR